MSATDMKTRVTGTPARTVSMVTASAMMTAGRKQALSTPVFAAVFSGKTSASTEVFIIYSGRNNPCQTAVRKKMLRNHRTDSSNVCKPSHSQHFMDTDTQHEKRGHTFDFVNRQPAYYVNKRYRPINSGYSLQAPRSHTRHAPAGRLHVHAVHRPSLHGK